MSYSLKSIQYNEDDRAQRALNVFDTLSGQVNVSYVNSTDHVVAWHRHKIQIDYWYCVKGSFKVGLVTPNNNSNNFNQDCKFEYLSEKNQRVLTIPPLVWHGYKAVEPGSILLYYLTRKYDPKDEYRAQPGVFGEDWGVENK
jgi:dTDP-4-dehydrorhamnose 3,5-epimerase-like enzyme